MLAISFNSVLIIAGISVLVPVVLGLLPRLPVPGAVLEVIAGIVVGPSVLGWVREDAPVQVLRDLGLGMLLFLAGLEIDVDRLRGPLSRLASAAFGASAVLGLLCGLVSWLAGQATQPLLLAIILMSTSAGLLLPLLKDAGEGTTEFGQLVMTAAALAEVVPIMLLSLFFSAASKTSQEQLISLGIFLALLVLIGLTLSTVRRLRGLDRMLDHLEHRSGQLRVRAALTLALACGVLAYRFGFASILGAFAAGLLVKLVEISRHKPDPDFQTKLEGIGFGFLIPIFFIATGVEFQLKDLLDHPVALAEVPLFLIALLFVRGLPALLYRRRTGTRRAVAAGLLQATTLTFVIVATQIGLAAGKVTPTVAAALVAAGLLSAALFPIGAQRLLSRAEPVPSGVATRDDQLR
ncbi:cation:proton antiporter [Trebonia sp.]|uniref:cation:proton antiporter n=1 Tax=Trebonia sp. TaxID=2767075 RepID=UPI00260346F2|nr:cation:proton antiporter [Trebonia sp.]